jgi:hypothetical protein
MVRPCGPATAGNVKNRCLVPSARLLTGRRHPVTVRSGTPSPISLAAASARERPPSPRRHL